MAAPNTSSPLPVVVVIGAGGMGLATAQRLGSGHHVVLADFSTKILDAAAAHLRGNGFQTTTHNVDISDAASTVKLAAAAAAQGRVTTIVHTAGLSPTMATADRIYAVDLIGTVNVIDAFAAVIEPLGSMLCIASMAASAASLTPDVEAHLATAPVDKLLECAALATDDPGTAYAISKRANVLRVESAAPVYGARGARINCISPGIIMTPMGQEELDGPHGEAMQMTLAHQPVKRAGTPTDITDVIAFLTGTQASYITGVNLAVDGGASTLIKAAGQAQKP